MDNILRKEIKYQISFEKYLKLKPRLSALLKYDTHSNEEGYMVRSLYFDTLENRDMYDTLYGLEKKHKIRLRIYSIYDSKVKLEWKRKIGTDSQKITFFISRNEAETMINGDYEFLSLKGDVEANELYRLLIHEVYQPRIVVEYKRIAYEYPVSNVRICIDSNINASLTPFNFFNENCGLIPIISTDMRVLEVKYDDFLPMMIKEVLSSIDELPQSNSKYVNARML